MEGTCQPQCFLLHLSTSKLLYHWTIDQKNSVHTQKSSNSPGKCYKPISYSINIKCCIIGRWLLLARRAMCLPLRGGCVMCLFLTFWLNYLNTIWQFLVFITAIDIIDTGYQCFMPTFRMWLLFFRAAAYVGPQLNKDHRVTKGILWTTFGQSMQHGKVLRRGAHFGPDLVQVHSVTKSSNERHILNHIWENSAVWHKRYAYH